VKKIFAFLFALALMLSFILVAVPSVIPTLAQGGEDDKLQMAPLNPDFIKFLEEPPENFYGYIPPSMDLSHLDGISAREEMALLAQQPSSWDWRDTGKVTPVENQNPCGTCWAFGTTSVLESAVLLGESIAYNFSEQSVALCVDRSWVYLYDESDEPCNGGGNSRKASEVFIKKGSVLESCNPYNTAGLNCDGTCVCDSCTPVKKVTGYRYVTGNGSQTALIKTAVSNNGPVTMSFHYTSSGEYADGTYGAIYDYYPCTENPNHLVSIIGWDDDVPHPDPDHSGTGAWLVKNSWGTADSWAGGATTSDGYFWMAYDSSCMTEIAYLEYGDYDPNETLYYWDEAGMYDCAGTGTTETYLMASVFTSAQDGVLTHVDFWTPDEDASYKIYVYNDGDPSDGLQNQLASQKGSCAELGYYSIPLYSPVPVSNGQQFTVAVEMTTPDWYWPIPIEYEDTGYCEPTIQTGVCFMSADGSVWADAGDVYDWNVCLRARTTDEFPALDHFECYNITGVEVPGLFMEEVSLGDQFGNLTASVTEAEFFCNPVEKYAETGEPLAPIFDYDHHLTLYGLDYEAEPDDSWGWWVMVDNQFGQDQELVVGNPTMLAVPSQKLLPTVHDPPVGLDHFLLYPVIPEGRSVNASVWLVDYNFDWADLVFVAEPAFFANPVEKVHGEEYAPIQNPEFHLVFYWIYSMSTYFPTDVMFSNQFDDPQYSMQYVMVQDPILLAVPSWKTDWLTTPVLDHFKCYWANNTSKIEEYVTLEDQFGSVDAEVVIPHYFCNPVGKSGEGIWIPNNVVRSIPRRDSCDAACRGR
jgi:C1A family cysteine protease